MHAQHKSEDVACQNVLPEFSLFIGQLWTTKPNFSSKSADLEVLFAQKLIIRALEVKH